MRVIYMGTPDFSVPALSAIVEAGHEVALVVTQPDKPKGRGGKVLFTPVKEKALEYGIEVFQPVKVREEENVKIIRDCNPDIIIVAAFGQILTKEILSIPKYGCVNIHASLLPRWRGAAPIQSAIIEGDKETGITIMQMDEGLDTGDMLMQEKVVIEADETGGSLHDKLADIGGRLIVNCMKSIEKGTVNKIAQSDEFTYATKLHKKMGLLNFTEPAERIECLIRGLNPWPAAFTYYNGKLLKIWKGEVVTDIPEVVDTSIQKPGMVVHVTTDTIYVATGKDYLGIKELQPEGKRRMPASDYLRGCKVSVGDMFISEE
ncbi:MAG: methionyl-tRNA formyltransferase [Lachnospiraceae bacterium]|nr:methionyl-tRNA formyltransferase [Lachnospiraceae bacterium]